VSDIPYRQILLEAGWSTLLTISRIASVTRVLLRQDYPATVRQEKHFINTPSSAGTVTGSGNCRIYEHRRETERRRTHKAKPRRNPSSECWQDRNARDVRDRGKACWPNCHCARTQRDGRRNNQCDDCGEMSVPATTLAGWIGHCPACSGSKRVNFNEKGFQANCFRAVSNYQVVCTARTLGTVELALANQMKLAS